MTFSVTAGKPATAASSGRVSHPEISLSVSLDSGMPIPAQLLELSRMDLMLLTDRPLQFGTSIQLAIFSDLISAVTYHRAVVHWARPHSRGWQIGAFLAQPLPDRLTEQAWSDLRNSLRYECNWKAWVLWDGGGQLEPVRIVNYSITRLRMRIDHVVLSNSRFSLFGSSGTRTPAVINGQVQWCRTIDDTIQVGSVILGQRGRELPGVFASVTAVHVKPSEAELGHRAESHDTLRCEQQYKEQFLPRTSSALPSVR